MQAARLKVIEERRTAIPMKPDLEPGNVRLRLWPASPWTGSTGIYQPKQATETRNTPFYCLRRVSGHVRVHRKCIRSLTCSVGGPRSTRLRGPKLTPIFD
jgi:hypothetical protein